MNANELIKKRRKELHLTQKEVADSVGVSEATVSRWESGNIANMGRDKIALLSKILNISPSIIAGYDENSSADELNNLTHKQKELYNTIIKFNDDKIDLALRVLRSILGENEK